MRGSLESTLQCRYALQRKQHAAATVAAAIFRDRDRETNPGDLIARSLEIG
jgi:hypothetical protein